MLKTIIILMLGLLIFPFTAVSVPAEPLPEGVDEAWIANLKNLLAPGIKAGEKEYTPLFSGWSQLGESADAKVGATIAPAGDVNADGYSDVIVGAPDFRIFSYAKGIAWVFLGGPDGLESSPCWSYEGYVGGCEFGFAVGCAGDVNADGYDDIVVGEPGRDNGWAYLFFGASYGVEFNPGWDHTPQSGPARFGASVATAGHFNDDEYDDFLVGAPESNAMNGLVLLFRGSSLLPVSPTTYLGSYNSRLGTSVAFAGDINGDGFDDWVAGGPSYYEEALPYCGLLHVTYGNFAMDSIRIHGDLHHLGLGYDVAGAGDVDGDGYADILVSTDRFSGECPEQNQVRLYRGTASGLSVTPDWIISNSTHTQGVFQVATAGDVNGDGYADALLGREYFDGTANDCGEVRLYLGGNGGLGADPEWTLETSQAEAYQGAVATAGDVNGDGYSDILIGARGWDGAFVDGGRVECFFGGGESLSEEPSWLSEGNQNYALLGYSLAAAGDVNGDGYADILVGAPQAGNGESYEGIVYLFHGSSSGPSMFPAWSAQSQQASAGFGASVSSAGDINGDGYADILIGAPFYDETETDEGGVFLWFGQRYSMPDGTPANADWSYFSGQANAQLGTSVALAGDVNGDGRSDIIIGAPFYDRGTTDEGCVFAFHGSFLGPGATYDWLHDTAKANCSYGASVASAGDVNGDRYSDIIVGAPTYSSPSSEEGFAFVYLGSEEGLLPGAPWWHGQANEINAHFGCSVASAGDVNSDGYSDFIIGAENADGSMADSGRCFVWLGGATAPESGTPLNADWVCDYPLAIGVGTSVASAGDVNNDGYSDIIVGAPLTNGLGNDRGLVLVYHGGPSGLDTTVDAAIGGEFDGGLLGAMVTSAGDVNGDGFCDVLVGAPNVTNGAVLEGRAYLLNGGGCEGLSRRLRQFESDGRTQVFPLNRSDGTNCFVVETDARSAAGRSSLRVASEVKPLEVPFSAADHFSQWTDTGAPAYGSGSMEDISEQFSYLYGGRPYKWRLRVESRNPYFPRSPWYSPAWNGCTEADIRTRGIVSALAEETVPVPNAPLVCFPNPFNPCTALSFTVPEAGPVLLEIFDVAGRRMATLVDEVFPAGVRQVVWDGRHTDGSASSSGVYLIRLETMGGVRRGQVVLVR